MRSVVSCFRSRTPHAVPESLTAEAMALESNSSLDAARETQMVRSISAGGETHECVMRVSEPQCSIEKKKKKKKRDLGHGSCSASVQSQESKKIKCIKQIELSGSGDSGDPVGYVHVRARRGQATDKHSLAERLRREKISEKMKVLQDLVPGCDKVVGKALVLDEIINYVQSLQNQVEYLSMKLDSMDLMVYNLGLNDSENLGNASQGSQPLHAVQQISNIEPSCISAPFSLQGQGPLIDFYQEDESFTMEEGEHKHGFLNLIELDNINMCSFQ